MSTAPVMTKQRYNLRGLVVSLNTPFDDQGRIDFSSFGRLLDWHLARRAVGFLTPAQAGEVPALRLEEKIALIRFAHQYTMGRAIVIASATADEEQESLAIAAEAVRLGCEGVLCEVPAGRRGDNVKISAFYHSLAAAGMPMLMIQDLDWNGSGLDIALIRQLFEQIECFRCLKVEVRPAGPKYTAVLEATGGLLHVSGGWAVDQMIEAMDRGVDVFMNTALTGLKGRIMEAYWQGDRQEARRRFHQILPVLAFTRQHLDVSIHLFKRFFYRRGVISTPHVRKKTVPFDFYHERYGTEVLEYLDQVEREEGLL
jgi:4-hydroxy-tetrahydrodipicolinate synthase